MSECPNGCGLLNESVAANTTGNDELIYCEVCGYHVESWTPYPHNDPEHPRYKYRHGLSEGVSSAAVEHKPPVGAIDPLAESVALCQCGCGNPAPIAKKTQRSKGHVRGQPMRFINGHALRKLSYGRQ